MKDSELERITVKELEYTWSGGNHKLNQLFELVP